MIRRFLRWPMTAHVVFQWPGVVMPWAHNWVDFDFVRCAVEYNKAGPCFEASIVILGIGVWASIALPWTTAQSRHLNEIVEEVRSDPESTRQMENL